MLHSRTTSQLIPHTPNLLIIPVQSLLHRLSLQQILFSRLIQDFYLLLVAGDLLLHLTGLLFELFFFGGGRVFFGLEEVFDFFEGFCLEEHFGFSFSDFQCVHCILFIQFNQGLLQLQNLVISEMDLCKHVLLMWFIFETQVALQASLRDHV